MDLSKVAESRGQAKPHNLESGVGRSFRDQFLRILLIFFSEHLNDEIRC
jgi:hypothetical protein